METKKITGIEIVALNLIEKYSEHSESSKLKACVSAVSEYSHYDFNNNWFASVEKERTGVQKEKSRASFLLCEAVINYRDGLVDDIHMATVITVSILMVDNAYAYSNRFGPAIG